jgi:hypothetical protein
LPLGVRHPADVVDQDVEAAEAGQHPPGQRVVAADRGMVGGEEVHVVVCRVAA